MRISACLFLLAVLAGVTARSAGAGSAIIVTDFERPSDRRLVETRRRATISKAISSHGQSSLKVRAGDYLNIRTPRLGLGRRRDLLKIDFFNARSAPQQVRAELFDATSRKGYWYRHVREYALRPGWSTLCFRVGRLYRGEKNSKRIRDSYLVPAEIRRIDLAFEFVRDGGFIYIDHIRFEPDPPMPKVDGLRAFDFGPENQVPRYGFTACSRETYNRKRGYGWSSSGWPRAVRDYTHPNDLLGDFREARGETFSVRVPNGAYHVRVHYEDHGWWESQFARFSRRTITVEGKQAWEERLTREEAAKRFYRFADTEPSPSTDVYDTYIRRGLYRPKEFDVAVADGKLDIGFDADRPMVCRVSAIVVWPLSQAKAAAAWCAELDRRMKQEFDAENVYIGTAPGGRSMRDIPGTARQGGLVVFAAGGSKPTGPGYIPVKGELLSKLTLFCAPGEHTGVSFSLRPTGRGGPVSMRTESAKLPAKLFVVQNRIKRHGGGYTIVPDILRPLGAIALEPRRTRQFWLEIETPSDAKPGKHAGEIQIDFSGHKRRIPLSVEVLPIELSEPKFAFGLFGLLPDSYAPPAALGEVVRLLKRHGMSSVAGVPLGRVGVKDGAIKVDFAEADEVMGLLRKAGFKLRVDTYGGTKLRGVRAAAEKLKMPPAEVLKLAMTQVRDHAKAKAWLPISYSMVDEPHWSDDAVRDATRAVRRVRTTAPWLMTNGYWSPSAGNKAHRELMDALGRTTLGRVSRATVKYLHSKGKGIGFYGGCSRHEFGLRQWSAACEGLDAHYAWHFYVRYGDLYYDLDSREPDVCMVYYTPTEIRPSLRLKSVRAGAYDFRYLQTLSDLSARAKGSPAAEEAKQLLDKARNAGNMYRRRPSAAIADLDVFRRKVADSIVRLTRGRRK